MHTMGNSPPLCHFPCGTARSESHELRFDWPTMEIPGTAGIMEITKDRTLPWPRATARRNPPLLTSSEGRA